ncbi:LuxR C-terminal-related transcriptional regulator [Mycobacterium sp. PSTR-4-N]|uniref:ATP-binding protein n=1 Tax=Mycobacterium sp. PSTR-4-N TaxID=2917745 RepID=UPI001F150766|nr:LuxR C-terminal-related transcriptional regulator [Mycobacterium sp. PSTR-4-N]MCG7597303.1 LuxR C-terminal-related transcriptional regulator [Mycobacterium sp. PSTR-4-N]
MPSESATSLPADIASFVGRREDILVVRQLFSSTRLVTLTGIGGVGKTRLALQLAKELQRAFPDGVYVVEFSTLSEGRLLRQAVLDALEVRELRREDAVNSLRGFLRRRRMLLILDNCEHVVEDAAALTTELLQMAPELRILATSRQPLRVTGEHVHHVAPLPTPDPDGSVLPGAVSHYPAVRLLTERTAAIVPEFEVTPDNEMAVARLSSRLEGIPLAIELAAVRLNVLSVTELADRLDDRFHVLRAGNRNMPERHRTLQNLVDWSFDLCTESERLLWIRSSVFAGSFAFDALAAVCADDRLPADELVDVLAGLVEKSIIVRDDSGGRARYRMLETLRAYGRVRLRESTEDELLAQRHCRWYAQLADRVTDEWIGPRQEEWAELMHLDHANLRAALEYCVSSPERAATAIRIAGQTWFWSATSHMHEATLWLDRALELATEPTPDRAWGLAARGYIAAFLGESDVLDTLPEQARDLAAVLGDTRALAFANHVIGFRQSLASGDAVRDAIPLLTDALQQHVDSGTAVQYHDAAMVELAVAHLRVDELDGAAALVDELHQRCSAAGERSHLGYALWLRGLLALIRGDARQAAALLAESVTIQRTFRDNLGLILTLEALAWSLAASGEGERAATILGGTEVAWKSISATEKLMHGWRVRHLLAEPSDLGDGAFDDARRRGSDLSLDDVVVYALDERPDDATTTTASHTLDQLTRREREVAGLVAEGLSNKEIAAKLVVSLRTAEGHVERILTKLGFRTRAQIASWFTEAQAVGDERGRNR